MANTVVLDAGHGGSNPGAVYNGRNEKDDALTLTLEIGEILERNGIDVVYTRTNDVFESPGVKAREANASGADLFVSIHRNATPVPNTYSGVESLVYSKEGKAYQVAKDINKEFEAVGLANLGITERPNLIVLNQTQMPAVLVEVGYINTDLDNILFDNEFDAIAQAIADGIIKGLG